MIRIGDELINKDQIIRVFANPMAWGDYFQTCTVVLKDGRSLFLHKSLNEVEALLK